MTATALGTVRLGTRRSALALAQAGAVADELRHAGYQVDLVEVVTDGDRSAQAVSRLADTGVFVTELRRRLVAGDVDVAVHSYKDLPTQPADGVRLAAVPRRADPRDALVAREGRMLAQLPAGSRVGTGAPRRAAQLRALGLGLEVEPLRGNVDTRLRRVAEGDLDAVVVAAAGLQRLGRLAEASEVLDPGQVLPAPAQGALAVETRESDGVRAESIAGILDDPTTRAVVLAERTVLARLAAGCTAPVGALADAAIGDDEETEIYLRAVVASLDGRRTVRASGNGPLAEAEQIGARLAADLLEAGAAEVMETDSSSTAIGDSA